MNKNVKPLDRVCNQSIVLVNLGSAGRVLLLSGAVVDDLCEFSWEGKTKPKITVVHEGHLTSQS